MHGYNLKNSFFSVHLLSLKEKENLYEEKKYFEAGDRRTLTLGSYLGTAYSLPRSTGICLNYN